MIDDFRRDIEKMGYRFDGEIIPDNNWHRCYFGQEKKSSGRYRLKFVDERFAIGNYGSDKDPEGFRSWHNKIGTKAYSKEARAAYRLKMEAEKKALETEREKKQVRLALRLEKLYHRLPEAVDDIDYLYKKKAATHGIKQRKTKRGAIELISPLYQIDGKIWNIQKITPNFKGFFPGAKVKGSFFPIGEYQSGALLITEGFATAASIYQATEIPTFAAMTAGNLESVALALKKKYPKAQVIICADNDSQTVNINGEPYNTGIVKARQAAVAIGGAKVIWPENYNDFNDMHVAEGLESVKLQILSAITLEDYAPHAQECDFNNSEWPFQILGYDEGIYYFIPDNTYQLAEFSPSAISNISNLFRLAPMDFWQNHFGGEKISTRKIVEYATNALIEKCHEKGIFDSMKMRGVGAWLDKGQVVIHAGGELVVNGKITALKKVKSKYIYPLRKKSFPVITEPLRAIDAVKLREICAKLSWENKLSGELLAGWIVIAPVCGALEWRPHIWIEGESESGKTTIIEKIIEPLMAGAAMRFDGGTTEAAIRQLLGIDALPIIYDEAEGESQKDKYIMEGILHLARRSSKGGVVGKGSSDGQGESYIARSCFCFSAINPMIKHRADESRISRLVLKKANLIDPEEYFRELKREIKTTFTKEYAAGLLARTIKLLPTIIKNTEVFTDAAAEELENRRAADQIGIMLAGLYSLTSDKEVTFDIAVDFIRKNQWTQHTAIEENKDWQRLITYISQAKIRYKNQEKYLGQVIELAWKNLRNIIADPEREAEKDLRYIGIWPRDDGIWIINQSSRLEEILKGTAWENNWAAQLRNVPNAERRDPNYFAIGMSNQRSVCVPYSAFNIEDVV